MKKVLVAAIALAMALVSNSFAADVNSDDAATIQKDLKGVGVVKAELIVAERTANGPFVDGEDLAKRVKGIGPMTVSNNTDMLEFGKGTPAKKSN